MNSNASQQAYDRGHTIFSPDGRLYQVEYAREAVERGSPSVGIRTDDGVVLAARKPVRSPLLEARTVEKSHRIDDHVAVASAGHAADARQLVAVARESAQRHRLRYGEPIGVESLTKAIADHVQEYTQTGGSRPYGTALLVAGVDETGPRLFEVDPSGTPYGWRAVAIGNGAAEIRGFLEDRIRQPHQTETKTKATASEKQTDGIGREAGLTTALEALATTVDEPLSTDEVDICVVDAETASVDLFSSDRVSDELQAAS
ncbi:archaeal proteasome endopeptidase complex subunit alpha [Natronoglomus mannanivorans]|uniref:Proteasome subunit alpha n=1 Tax=Natronoglomus mannanivorans TaxID=2979990 RepID=A0AAP3E2K3_9EURY|nr:archaeal proteasome endopeptidase complex subunit alpha [Halobacteria archaeon AArc-xg1-1]